VTQTVNVQGEVFQLDTSPQTAREIEASANKLLTPSARSVYSAEITSSLRMLVLRQADTVEPEGAPRCDLVRRVFSEPSVRQLISSRAKIAPGISGLTAVDLSYGQVLALGSYAKGGMRYTAAQFKALHTIALWIGDGIPVGRGYELVESQYGLPASFMGYSPSRKPAFAIADDLTIAQRETASTLMRDGLDPRDAVKIAAVL